MIRSDISKTALLFVSFLLISFFVVSCGDDSMPPGKMKKAGEQDALSDTGQAPVSGTSIPSGWKKVSYDEFSFSVPTDWKEEKNTGVWFPGTESFDMGLPKISLQCGGMPVMPGQTVDGQLKEMLHGSEPLSKTPVKKCNIPGHIRKAKDEWGLQHLALTLEEPSGAGMVMVHFFNCRAPAGQFSKYSEIFRKILDSVHCD